MGVGEWVRGGGGAHGLMQRLPAAHGASGPAADRSKMHPWYEGRGQAYAGARRNTHTQAILLQSRTRRNSITPSRAFLTRGVSVLIFMPGPAGIAQLATGLGDFSTCSNLHVRQHVVRDVEQSTACRLPRAPPHLCCTRCPRTSTRHIRQLPAMDKRWW